MSGSRESHGNQYSRSATEGRCGGTLLEYPDSGEVTRKLYSVCIARLEDMNLGTLLPERYFSCLLVLDASDIPDEVISRATGVLLDRGAVALCAWGPDCSKVETLFDTVCVDRELAGTLDYLVTTTSHEDETLDDALWFLLCCTWGSEIEGDKCAVITVGNTEWDAQVRRRLSDVKGLDDVVPDTSYENRSGSSKGE